MATQQPTRATLPAPTTAAVGLPGVSITTSRAPTAPTAVPDAFVPIIKPYIVAGSGGNGAFAAQLNKVRSQISPASAAIGQVAAVISPRSGALGTAGALGKLVAKVVVKSGKVLLEAGLTGASGSSASLNTHLPMAFEAEGTTTTDLVVIGSAEALFGSDGRFSGLKPFDLAFAGDGSIEVAAAAAGAVVVSGGTAGQGSLSAATGQPVAFGGVGQLAMAQGAPVDTTGSGALLTVSSAKAGVDMAHTGTGQLSMVVVPSFAPAGMTKSSPAWTQMANDWLTVAGWAADTGTYPGSTVNTDGIVAQAAKASATLAASIVFTAAGAANANVTLRLTVNGVVVATGTATTVPASSTATVTVSVVRSIASGDVVRVQALGTQFLAQFNPTAQVNSASYVRIT
ncbi:hypothetical protein [Nocardia alba]|uniref:Uncharacterized protein n=1 Tax=Nocardia alba TaxID=225051 RepID=A0A4R1G1S1_9NOCA|nr:hypothetical protein [Nocardia alba]TCK00541.1 hypothetical protein DFR71_1544 [Nocardia alba]